MPEFFSNDEDVDFSLPGDDALLEAVGSPELDAINEVAQTGEQAEEKPERLRDELGRFASVEQPAAEAPENVVEAVEDANDEQPLLGKFKSQEDLLRAYESLEQRLGQQSSELGELRALREQVSRLEDRTAVPPPQPMQPITQDMIDSDPARAAELAYKQDDGHALSAALAEWKEIDPFAAALFVSDKKTEIALKQQREELEAKYSPLVQHAESSAQANANAQFISSLDGDSKQFLASDDFESLANEFPILGRQFLASDPAVRAEAVKTLKEIHRGRVSDTLEVTQTEVARETAAQAQAARDEAFVASPSTSSAGAKPSLADQIAADWDREDKFWAGGWNV